MTRPALAMTGDGPRIIAGVEMNSDGRRTAYHIWPQAPDLPYASVALPMRVDARDIAHVFEAKFPAQVRGISWLAPIATSLVEIDRLQDALLARYATAALFAGFVTDPDGTAFDDAKPEGPNLELSMEPGVMRKLPPGSTVQWPNVPGVEGAPEFLRHMLRSVAAGGGVPYEVLTADLSMVNYSSARLGFEQFRRRVKAIQNTLLVGQFLDGLWRKFAMLEILTGRLRARDFEARPLAYLNARFAFPAWQPLDPLKQAKADTLLLNARLRSRAELIAENGRDPDDVDAEIERDPLMPPELAATSQTLIAQPEDAPNA